VKNLVKGKGKKANEPEEGGNSSSGSRPSGMRVEKGKNPLRKREANVLPYLPLFFIQGGGGDTLRRGEEQT